MDQPTKNWRKGGQIEEVSELMVEIKALYDPERRSRADRRTKELSSFSRYWLTGRRGSIRRKEDRQKLWKLDQYSPKMFAVILSIVGLSVLDAMFTLELVDRGAGEVNPIMAYYLNWGPFAFFCTKYFITFASVLVILLGQSIYPGRRWGQLKHLYLALIIVFSLVVYWELYLMFFSNGP
jgi:hypothetical protein